MRDADRRALIICADDYAQSPAIDAAILALIRQGVLTATSCMTLSPYWPHASAALTTEICTRADIGLHLDFTQFSQTLRLPHPQLVLRSLLRLLMPAAIRANVCQQLDAFTQATGRAPDYIDGHLHVHQLPMIREALLAELQQRYAHLPVRQRPWLRISSPPAGSGFKARLIHWLGAHSLQRLAAEAGFRVSPNLLGVYDFSGDAASYQAHWQRWAQQLAALPHEAEALPPVLMCHPAQPSTVSAGVDPIAAARVVEWQVLQSPEFQRWLQHSGIQAVKGTA